MNKLYTYVVAIACLSSIIGYGAHLIRQNTILEESTKAYEKSIINLSNEINDYAINIETLRNVYTTYSLKEQEFNQRVNSHDYEKLARIKPVELERVLNDSIHSMWNEIREFTGYFDVIDKVTSATTPGTDKPPGSQRKSN